MTIGDSFFNDVRLKKIERELLSLLGEYQQNLKGIKSADLSKAASFKEEIEALEATRGQPLWFSYLGSGFGKGSFVELADGSVKLDFISGIGPHIAGHSSHRIIESSLRSALEDIVMQGNLQQNEEGLLLAERLTRLSGFDHCFISSSGAMANENGLKIAFQKKPFASRVLAFDRCFAGRSMVLSQITDKPSFREGLPTTIDVDYIPFYDEENPEESTQKSIDALERILHKYPGRHAVMILELVQGEGGFWVGSKQFFHAIGDILKREKIAFLADEVQTFGRTSQLFAFQHFDLSAYVDICTIGKASLVSATLYNDNMAPKKGLLGQTFTSSTTAIRGAITLLDWFEEGHLFGEKGRNTAIYNRFHEGLLQLCKKYPNTLRGPFGIGSMIAFTYKNGEAEETRKLNLKLFEYGLITFVAGNAPTRIRMLPPALVVTDNEIDLALEIIEKAIS